MKGFVPTPVPVVDLMIDKLFRQGPPVPDASILDPGCGRGAFIDGICRWCATRGQPLPRIVGVESNPTHLAVARHRFSDIPRIELRQTDFLEPAYDQFDYIVGNPPYVPITGLSEDERRHYRRAYSTARGRFDLYLLFFEQALRLLAPRGRLVFITPEKFLYVDSARPLRKLLSEVQVDELEFIDEDTFGELVTYPLVTSLTAMPPQSPTRLRRRDGTTGWVNLGGREQSWLPVLAGGAEHDSGIKLADVCTRISCGVATGADSVFVVANDELTRELRRFARPTMSGRQLPRSGRLRPTHSLILPYSAEGRLLDEGALGELGAYLRTDSRREQLLARTCTARKPWYAFHETPPLVDILRPKLLCKDITATPYFVADPTGEVVPRHSLYYVVPADPAQLKDLLAYLNSSKAREWIQRNCQRAANGFIRLQSHTLKRLPVPQEFAPPAGMAGEAAARARSA